MSKRKIIQPPANHPKPPATLLKELPPGQRAKIMEILDTHTYKDAEPLVQNLVGFHCTTDVLCRFRKWQETLQEMDLAHDRLRQIAEFQKGPLRNLPPDELRDLGAALYTLTCLARDDSKGFTRASQVAMQNERERIRAKRLALDELKFEDIHRRKFQAVLDLIGKRFEKNPQAMNLFEQARALLALPENR